MLDAFSIPGKKVALLCERAFRYVRLLQREGRDSAQLVSKKLALCCLL